MSHRPSFEVSAGALDSINQKIEQPSYQIRSWRHDVTTSIGTGPLLRDEMAHITSVSELGKTSLHICIELLIKIYGKVEQSLLESPRKEIF